LYTVIKVCGSELEVQKWLGSNLFAVEFHVTDYIAIWQAQGMALAMLEVNADRC
jgi:hypothetical protein